MNFRLGIIARSDKTGLGYQTKSYVKHLNPAKVILIDLSPLNQNEQNSYWYAEHQRDGNLTTISGIPTDDQIRAVLSGLDVVLTAETPYNLNLYRIAREMGVKTVCVENAEFYDHKIFPDYEMPDLIIMPSVWKLDEITEHAESRGAKVIQIHHPVDRDEITYIPRTGHTFIHIAGKPAMHDRNGTWEYMQANPTGKVTTQSDDLSRHIAMRYSQAKIYPNVPEPNQMYQMGDILVLPRKYGGNCLVLNEALASGMPVIMTDISPNNHLLPAEWLVPAEITGHFEPRTRVDVYTVNVRELVNKMDWFKTQDISAMSAKANEIAESISWKTLKQAYVDALESLL